MGFSTGKPIGEPGKYKACLIGKENYCEKENVELLAENLSCTGTESRLIECGGVFKSKCSNY